MLVIGLTGGIGTGKTEVTHILRELGAVVIESDKVAHLSYRPGTEAYRAIVNQFGRKILDDSGVIDRTSLGAIVFSDRAQREELESIVWPAARKWIENRLVEEERRGSQVVVIEVPKLFEAGWDQFTNVVWTVEATHGEIGQRVRERAGLTEAETDARVAAQMTCEERIARADLVIENNSTLEDLRERVIKTWETVPALESANPK
ncbi:MAG: dephospho-CoA kinase [Dehalococcoidia bacterium]|nr:dephospho-CoA kinase [Dehalococcoidia bacterium]